MSATYKKNGVYYYIETGYGFDVLHSKVIKYKSADVYGTLKDGELIFTGTFFDCVDYVENI